MSARPRIRNFPRRQGHSISRTVKLRAAVHPLLRWGSGDVLFLQCIALTRQAVPDMCRVKDRDVVFDGVGELPVETDSKFAVGIEKRCGEARHLIHYALPPPRVFVDSAVMINVLELPDMNIWNRRRHSAHDVVVIEEAISGNPTNWEERERQLVPQAKVQQQARFYRQR